MNKLNRNALVAYSDRQMFELVNNIEDYPRFLPWCSKSVIISRTKKEVVAELEITWKGVRKSFTTKNTLDPYAGMRIELVNGPLKHLEGDWFFQKLEDKACKVMLNLEFEFAGSFVDRFFEPVFQHIANTLVDAFCKRAVDLYGNE